MTTAGSAQGRRRHGPAGPEGPRRVLRRDRHQGRNWSCSRSARTSRPSRPEPAAPAAVRNLPLGLQLLHVNDPEKPADRHGRLVPRPERRTSPADDLLSGDVPCSRAIHNQPCAPLSDVSEPPCESAGKRPCRGPTGAGDVALGAGAGAGARSRTRAPWVQDRPLVDDLDGQLAGATRPSIAAAPRATPRPSSARRPPAGSAPWSRWCPGRGSHAGR